MLCSQQAVLGRRLVVAEVYDIMARVQTLLVRAHSPPVRQLASSVSDDLEAKSAARPYLKPPRRC